MAAMNSGRIEPNNTYSFTYNLACKPIETGRVAIVRQQAACIRQSVGASIESLRIRYNYGFDRAASMRDSRATIR